MTSLQSVQKFPLPSLIQTIPVTIITKEVLEHLAHPWSDTLNFTLILRKVPWDSIQAVSWPRGIEKRFYCTSRLPISPMATNIQIKIPAKYRYKCVSFHYLPWPSIPIAASREVVHESTGRRLYFLTGKQDTCSNTTGSENRKDRLISGTRLSLVNSIFSSFWRQDLYFVYKM